MRTFALIIRRLNEAMMWVVGILILIMGLTLFYDVMMRYFFKAPTAWSFDLAGWFTGLSAFLAGGYALLKKAHIRVDIFYQKFSPRVQGGLDALTSVFLFLIVLILVWKGGERTLHNLNIGAVANTGLNIYIWIKWLMVPLGGVLLGLQAIVNLVDDVYLFITGRHLIDVAEDG
ncbi:MAG: hypothetical protein BAA01_15500 [Bacillus thermozeamaize]|uniref:Tripartite ATP-independent periplasmic transporters DctQ component domain-containing protein n=1 Tax=Bacillus thermozeamaize TaxID=230954 RepID=A0A1Y3PIB2_9BACI|nr:MAG: hypothetical protein BAA01_15500 [Bacillus thermozeamaize]